jgi:hypothetical protein
VDMTEEGTTMGSSRGNKNVCNTPNVIVDYNDDNGFMPMPSRRSPPLLVALEDEASYDPLFAPIPLGPILHYGSLKPWKRS